MDIVTFFHLLKMLLCANYLTGENIEWSFKRVKKSEVNKWKKNYSNQACLIYIKRK